MLQFISPAALWTLAALALPLAIHLRRRPATTVRLGSLRFLDRLPQRRLRHLRWRERTLLLTRLALLALLAFLCANMRWLQPRAPGPQRWLLLDPTARLSGEAAVRARALLAQGFKAHLLAPGFPDANASTAAFASPGSNVTAPDLWSLLRAADAALPPGSRLAIVTPGRLAALRGSRPALTHVRAEWLFAPDIASERETSWIEAAGRVIAPHVAAGAPAAARVVVGTSGPMGTRFSVRPGGAAAAGESDPTVEFAPGGAQARLSGPPAQPWVTVAPLPPRVRVEILHDTDRGAEAHAIAAAVQAASEVQGRPVALEDRALSDPIGALPPADWYFWLSARDVPAELSAGMANVWSESAASRDGTSGITADRVVALNGAPGADAIGSSAPRLRRRSPPSIANTDVGTAVLWTDGHGAPLLTLNRTGGQHFAFFSRFDPDWSDFRGGTLPAAVSDLLFPSSAPVPIDSARDVRLADPSQYVVSLANPRTGFTFPPVLPGAANATDLHWLLWLLAASLFAAERFLSRPTFAAAVPIPAQRTAVFVP